MTAKLRKPLLVNVTWAAFALLGLAVLYVLSFAPVTKWRMSQVPLGHEWVPSPAVYRPVDWLTGATPLGRPLLWWARLWGDEVNLSCQITAMRYWPEDQLYWPWTAKAKEQILHRTPDKP